MSGSTDLNRAGNGSLMRLAPVPMFYFPDLPKTVHLAGESSRTTHGASECVEACQLFASMLFRALLGQNKAQILFGEQVEVSAPKLIDIGNGMYTRKSEAEIRGSGYVVESLEAALWCFYQTDSFESAVLQAANLGDDADTTAAICGQIAGAFYGKAGIPEGWLERLYMREEITDLADKLMESNEEPT